MLMPQPQPLRLRRIYEDPSPEDGKRVLVDRVWPRGLTKDAASIDLWLKDAAPSTLLRQWYGHRPERFEEFRRRYLIELTDPLPEAAVNRLRVLTRIGPVTLLTATRDLEHSQAAVLAELLRGTRGHPMSAAVGPGVVRRRQSAGLATVAADCGRAGESLVAASPTAPPSEHDGHR
jgi:uncharacterized protein YeaO (DUF488 family)